MNLRPEVIAAKQLLIKYGYTLAINTQENTTVFTAKKDKVFFVNYRAIVVRNDIDEHLLRLKFITLFTSLLEFEYDECIAHNKAQ